jgi:hypothetical protein
MLRPSRQQTIARAGSPTRPLVDRDQVLPPTLQLPPRLQHVAGRPRLRTRSAIPWGRSTAAPRRPRPGCRVPRRQHLEQTVGGNSVDLQHSDAVVNNHCYDNATMGTHREHSETTMATSRRDVPGLWCQQFLRAVPWPGSRRQGDNLRTSGQVDSGFRAHCCIQRPACVV